MSSLPPELDFTADPSATPARMDTAMLFILAYLRRLEALQPELLSVIADLRATGLSRLDSVLSPIFVDAETISAQLTAIKAAWITGQPLEQLLADLRAQVTTRLGNVDAQLAANLDAVTQRLADHSVPGPRAIQVNGSTGLISIKGDSGGWAIGYFFQGDNGQHQGGFGAYGSASNLTYYYIGKLGNEDVVVRPGEYVSSCTGLRVTGFWGSKASSATGPGVELGYSGSNAYVFAYNRDTAGYLPLHIEGSAIVFSVGDVVFERDVTMQRSLYLPYSTANLSVAYRIGSSSAVPSIASLWTAAQHVTLVDAQTIAVDLSTFVNAKVTLGGNRTLGAPTNAKPGQSGSIEVFQDATGGRTLAYATAWSVGATVPVLSTAANARDVLRYEVLSDGKVDLYLSKAR